MAMDARRAGRLKKLAERYYARHPAGSGKGGQFAPKEGAGATQQKSSANGDPRVFADYQEAQGFLSKKYPDTQFRLEGLDADSANSIARSYDDLASEFPLVAASIKGLTTGQGEGSVMRLTEKDGLVMSNTGVLFEADSKIGGFAQSLNGETVIAINPANCGTASSRSAIKANQSDFAKRQGVCWTVDTVNDVVGSTLAHEFGHALDEHIRHVYFEEDYFNNDEAFLGAMEAGRGFFDYFNDKEEAKTLSAYAATNREETFAESFVAYRSKDRSLANHSLVQSMKTILEKYKSFAEIL